MSTLLRVNIGAFRRTLGPHALALAAVVALAPSAFALCGLAAGARLPVWTAVLVVAPVLLVDRSRGLEPSWLWLVLVLAWIWQVPGWSWWCLAAAGCALAGHTATAVLASVPPETRLPRETVRRYAVRAAVVLALTTVVAVAAAGLREHAQAGGTAYAVVAIALACGLLAALRR